MSDSSLPLVPDMRRVVVAVKPRQRGLPLAAEHARLLARACGGSLLLASSVFDGRIDAALERRDTAAAKAHARMLDNERADLERLAGSLRDWGVSVATRAVWEAPAYAGILRAARDWNADLVVVGAHEARAAAPTRLTDTDWQLMRRCSCPLLLVKDPAFDGYPYILAAIDPALAHNEPSDLDAAVLAAGARVARIFGSELGAVHAFADPEELGLTPVVQLSPGEYFDLAGWAKLHRAATVAAAAPYGVAEERVVTAPGDPVDVIVDAVEAARARLVVVGTARRTPLMNALLGSTAEAVAASVACDVLFVPPPAASEAARPRAAAEAEVSAPPAS
jgi:universal stress protein E